MLKPSKSTIGCFAVFTADKQIKVFHKASYYDAFEKAKLFADESHNAGYPCTVEEFTFSVYIGVLVYTTGQSN